MCKRKYHSKCSNLKGPDKEAAESLDGSKQVLQRELAAVLTQVQGQLTLPLVNLGELLL